MKQLTRDQMKNLKGGVDDETADDDFGGGYMCCWTGTSNCSICVPAGYPSCEAGATPKRC